ncbi:MAG TPA: SDR family oxidoreductase [Ktedonobacteraceae bacterium]|nr:SDR family oxidoreductase [Ktedonobacteraceae bacterium]
MQHQSQRVALITGGSRGIGAATALALADRGYDVALTYRNKATRAREVVAAVTQYNVRGLALACDMTHSGEIACLFQRLVQWTDHLDVVVLNASGGLERALVGADPLYPMHINRDAQLQFTCAALPLMLQGSVVVFVTSHWAHLYGQMEQLPAYEPVAESKHAGEQALRARQDEFAARGVRLIVVTGSLIEGTIAPKLLQRTAPGLIDQQRSITGTLLTAEEMGKEIALAAMKTDLPNGSTVVAGAPLQSMLLHHLPGDGP